MSLTEKAQKEMEEQKERLAIEGIKRRLSDLKMIEERSEEVNKEIKLLEKLDLSPLENDGRYEGRVMKY